MTATTTNALQNGNPLNDAGPAPHPGTLHQRCDEGREIQGRKTRETKAEKQLRRGAISVEQWMKSMA